MDRPDPDGAFFVDWSEWADLGGGTWDYPPSRRNHPRYHCLLKLRVAELGGIKGFALRVPTDARIRDSLKRAGTTQCLVLPERAPWQAERHHWHYLPADRWRDLRAVLPSIKSMIEAKL